MPRGGPSITTESYPEDSNVQPEVRTTVSEPNRETGWNGVREKLVGNEVGD